MVSLEYVRFGRLGGGGGGGESTVYHFVSGRKGKGMHAMEMCVLQENEGKMVCVSAAATAATTAVVVVVDTSVITGLRLGNSIRRKDVWVV